MNEREVVSGWVGAEVKDSTHGEFAVEESEASECNGVHRITINLEMNERENGDAVACANKGWVAGDLDEYLLAKVV